MEQTRRYLGPNKKFTTMFGKITTEDAKLRALRAHMPYLLACLCFLRALIFLRASIFLRTFRAFIFLRGFIIYMPYVSSFVYLPSFFYVPSFCYVPYVPSFFTWLHFLRACILFMCFLSFMSLLNYVPSTPSCFEPYAPSCLACLRASWSLRALISRFARLICAPYSRVFKCNKISY